MDDTERSAQMAKAIRVVAVEHQAGRDDERGCAVKLLLHCQLGKPPPERRFYLRLVPAAAEDESTATFVDRGMLPILAEGVKRHPHRGDEGLKTPDRDGGGVVALKDNREAGLELHQRGRVRWAD